MSAYTLVDATASFIANLIVQKARSEVQIIPINPKSATPAHDMIIRHELPSGLFIHCATWINDQILDTQMAQNKRSHEEVSHAPARRHSLFAVALSLGQIKVYSAYTKKEVYTVSTEGGVRSMTGSARLNGIWIMKTGGVLAEIDVTTQTTIREFDLEDSSVAHLKRAVSKNSAALLLLSLPGTIRLINRSKPGKKALATYTSSDTRLSATAPEIVQVGPHFYVWLKDSRNIVRLNFKTFSNSTEKIVFGAGTVRRVANLDNIHVAIFTDSHVEVYRGLTRVSTVTAIGGDDVVLENMFKLGNKFVLVWHDRNMPQFVAIDSKIKPAVEIHIDGRKPSKLAAPTAPQAKPEASLFKLALPNGHPALVNLEIDPVKMDNQSPTKLFQQLSELLLGKKVSQKKVVRLCASNDNEDNIKETVRLFSQLERRDQLVEELFLAVSLKVAADPLAKTSLSVWLKWVLQTHGGFILKREKLDRRLHELQGSLEGGVGMMLRLLALRGRLQMLRSQAEFRSRDNDGEDDDSDENGVANGTLDGHEKDDEEDDEEAFEDGEKNGDDGEESIVYVNGEEDDFQGFSDDGGDYYDDEEDLE